MIQKHDTIVQGHVEQKTQELGMELKQENMSNVRFVQRKYGEKDFYLKSSKYFFVQENVMVYIKKTEWANKNGEYNRNLTNWIELCRKCHLIYDRKYNWGKATKKFNL